MLEDRVAELKHGRSIRALLTDLVDGGDEFVAVVSVREGEFVEDQVLIAFGPKSARTVIEKLEAQHAGWDIAGVVLGEFNPDGDGHVERSVTVPLPGWEESKEQIRARFNEAIDEHLGKGEIRFMPLIINDT